MITAKDITAALESAKAVADAIRELREVPSGHLYAQLMPVLSFKQYEHIIGILVDAGLVEIRNNLLVWKEAA